MVTQRKAGKRPEWLNGDNSYTLLVPVEYHVGTEAKWVTELKLRRLTANEMEIIDEGIGWTKTIRRLLEAMMAEIPPIVFGRLDAVDVDRIDDIFGYFMEPGSVTGGTS